MLCVRFPDNCRAERSWICAVLLREFLGLEFEVRFEDQEGTRIEAEGKVLELPDVFFKRAAADWLGAGTLPARPLPEWIVPDSGIDARLVAPSIPVIFGGGGCVIGEDRMRLDIDVFGSAFFMLSRYEEAVNSSYRDCHDRFLARASLAHQEGFLERPIIDEYLEILWSIMRRLWPRATRREHSYSVQVSCDVDHPYHPGASSFRRMARTTLRKAVRRNGEMSGVTTLIRNYLGFRRGDLRHDPYYFTVDWIMDMNERAGNVVAFNFIPETTDPVFDDTCPISHSVVRAMLERIHLRGHEIGLHPGYRTYESVGRTTSALNTLRSVLSQTRIPQSVDGGRIHYLRWSTKTPAVWDGAGLAYDSTLSFAEYAGFRCGTCREYSMFDLHARKPLRIKQRPLICMDCSVVTYMGYGFTSDALERMNKLKRAAQMMKGTFSLLWHNSNLDHPGAREIYCEVIK